MMKWADRGRVPAPTGRKIGQAGSWKHRDTPILAALSALTCFFFCFSLTTTWEGREGRGVHVLLSMARCQSAMVTSIITSTAAAAITITSNHDQRQHYRHDK